MLITREKNLWDKKEYWTISTGKEGVLEGVTRYDLLELGIEIVSLLDNSQLAELEIALKNEMGNR
jgi:hypothetical protein